MTRLLVTGAAGGLGRVLVADAERAGLDVVGVDQRDADLTASAAAQRLVADVRPTCVINAAAWTDVDAAEQDESAAMAVNGHLPGHLARACADTGARLVHVSTDFVFGGPAPTGPDGARRGRRPDDEPDPVQAYGRTKLAGEQQVAASGAEAVVVRTSTLASPGRPSFVAAVAARARAGASLYAPVDRWSSPTFAVDLSPALLELVGADVTGIVHRSNHGPRGVSKHGLAAAVVQQLGLEVDVEERLGADVEAGMARRPAWSVLDQTGADSAGLGRLPEWRSALASFLSTDAAP